MRECPPGHLGAHTVHHVKLKVANLSNYTFFCSGHVGLWETDQPADGLDGLSGTAELSESNDELTSPQVKLDQLEHMTASLGFEAIGTTIVMGLPGTQRRTKQRTEQNDN